METKSPFRNMSTETLEDTLSVYNSKLQGWESTPEQIERYRGRIAQIEAELQGRGE